MTNANNIDECRQQYATIRDRSQALSTKAFDAKVKAEMVKRGITDPTPAQWVSVAATTCFACKRCGGSGKFTTWVLNGVPQGPGGDCYRCAGKGYQNDADARRNYGADMHISAY